MNSLVGGTEVLKRKKCSLQTIIMLLITLSMLVTMSVSIATSYLVNREQTIQNTLQSNEAYAQKLAKTTDGYLNDILNIMDRHTIDLVTCQENKQCLSIKADDLRNEIKLLDSIVIVDEKSIIVGSSPQSMNIVGKKATAEEVQQVLKDRTAYISKPYIGPYNKKLQTMIAVPIYDFSGQFKGVLTGRIYLQTDNMLHQLLGEHYEKDGTYVYVVDQEGKVIYHKQKDWINQNISEMSPVTEVSEGKTGAIRFKQEEGELLSGFSPIQKANWGIIVEKSTNDALTLNTKIMYQTILTSAIFIFFIMLIVWIISIKMIQPLKILSHYASVAKNANEDIPPPVISTFYVEAAQLKETVLDSIHILRKNVKHFKQASTIDPLTKLVNRRAVENYLDQSKETNEPFAALLIDIDYFKRINDTYGHDIGDQVLVLVAQILKKETRHGDICARWGGEEFLLILPATPTEAAFHVAERIRLSIMHADNPSGETITVSIGIAGYPDNDEDALRVIKLADESLYQAKRNGRNRVCLSNKE